MYAGFVKRIIDIVCALLAILVFGWLYILVAVLVRINLGSPVIFKQPRPGLKDENGREKIFCLYKFRSMTDERDENGKLLPDAARITPFGKKLRDWSLDEIPQVFNILMGDMSVIGPRPQLVRDMVFMTEKQRERHNVRPGLSGLAQISGRNALRWDGKLEADLKYIENVSFLEDVRILIITVIRVLRHEGVSDEGHATVDDYGDVLLSEGKITEEEYASKQAEAMKILAEAGY